jgi:hypothetical protein
MLFGPCVAGIRDSGAELERPEVKNAINWDVIESKIISRNHAML